MTTQPDRLREALRRLAWDQPGDGDFSAYAAFVQQTARAALAAPSESGDLLAAVEALISRYTEDELAAVIAERDAIAEDYEALVSEHEKCASREPAPDIRDATDAVIALIERNRNAKIEPPEVTAIRKALAAPAPDLVAAVVDLSRTLDWLDEHYHRAFVEMPKDRLRAVEDVGQALLRAVPSREADR